MVVRTNEISLECTSINPLVVNKQLSLVTLLRGRKIYSPLIDQGDSNQNHFYARTRIEIYSCNSCCWIFLWVGHRFAGPCVLEKRRGARRKAVSAPRVHLHTLSRIHLSAMPLDIIERERKRPCEDQAGSLNCVRTHSTTHTRADAHGV